VTGQGRRRDGLIVLLDEQHNARKIWRFSRGLPMKYTGPSMNATQNAVAIESIEIAHEGVIQIAAGGPGA
jgi:phage tail-like protein